MTQYDDVFFAYVNSGALRSARRFLPALLQHLAVDSVLDVGCDQGARLSVWQNLDVGTSAGINGAYVDKGRLLCARDTFIEHDLAQPFDLGRRFALLQNLEVAEHLPPAGAPGVISSLTCHRDMANFSAASPW